MDNSSLAPDDVPRGISSPCVDPSVFIFSDAITQAMASFAEAHTQSMAAMADRNSEALATAVEKITATLLSREGHISPEVPSPVSSPSPSAHTFLVADKGAASPPARAHTSQVASVDFCLAAPLRLRKRKGAHTDLSVATIVASGHSG